MAHLDRPLVSSKKARILIALGDTKYGSESGERPTSKESSGAAKRGKLSRLSVWATSAQQLSEKRSVTSVPSHWEFLSEIACRAMVEKCELRAELE